MSVFRSLRGRVPERWIQRWPTIRAVLITYHVVAVLLLAFPAPYGVMDRSLWKEASVQAEIGAWAGRLGSIGIHVTREGLEERLWNASQRLLSVRSAVLVPFTPYEHYFGVEQAWRMFSAPNRFPVRLEVAVRVDGAWQTVYESQSDEHTWMRVWFDDHSLRRIVFKGGWERNRDRYVMLCDWIARRAARDFPDARYVRIRHFQYRVPTPAEVRAGIKTPEGHYEDDELRVLPNLRGAP